MDSQDVYMPRAKIFLADRPSATKEQGQLSYFRCKVLYESFEDMKKAYHQLARSAYKPFKLQNDLMGPHSALVVYLNFAGQPCEISLGLSLTKQYEKQQVEIVSQWAYEIWKTSDPVKLSTTIELMSTKVGLNLFKEMNLENQHHFGHKCETSDNLKYCSKLHPLIKHDHTHESSVNEKRVANACGNCNRSMSQSFANGDKYYYRCDQALYNCNYDVCSACFESELGQHWNKKF